MRPSPYPRMRYARLMCGNAEENETDFAYMFAILQLDAAPPCLAPPRQAANLMTVVTHTTFMAHLIWLTDVSLRRDKYALHHRHRHQPHHHHLRSEVCDGVSPDFLASCHVDTLHWLLPPSRRGMRVDSIQMSSLVMLSKGPTRPSRPTAQIHQEASGRANWQGRASEQEEEIKCTHSRHL